MDAGRTRGGHTRALALEAFSSRGCLFRGGLGGNRFCSCPAFYRQTTSPFDTIILQKNAQRSRRPPDWKWVFTKFPTRGGLGRVLLLHINPPPIQGRLSQLHPQERGFEGRNGRGALNPLPAEPGEDTPRRLRLQCRGGGSGQVHSSAVSWAAAPRLLEPLPPVAPPRWPAPRDALSRPQWAPGCGPPTRPLCHPAQRPRVFQRLRPRRCQLRPRGPPRSPPALGMRGAPENPEPG